MTRELLKSYVARGLSLEQMGSLVDRHPSTVAYWLKKHGLEAVHREKYAAKARSRGASSRRL